MAAMSDYLENKLIDHIFRGVSFTAPSNLYVALLTANPTDANTSGGNELGTTTPNNYARVNIAANTTNWASTGGATTTTNEGNKAAMQSGDPSFYTWVASQPSSPLPVTLTGFKIGNISAGTIEVPLSCA